MHAIYNVPLKYRSFLRNSDYLCITSAGLKSGVIIFYVPYGTAQKKSILILNIGIYRAHRARLNIVRMGFSPSTHQQRPLRAVGSAHIGSTTQNLYTTNTSFSSPYTRPTQPSSSPLFLLRFCRLLFACVTRQYLPAFQKNQWLKRT